MTWVEGRVGVDDADDGPGKGVLAVAQGFDEDFAEEEGEVGVAVGGEALTEAGGGGYGLGEVVVSEKVVFRLLGWGIIAFGCFGAHFEILSSNRFQAIGKQS